MRGSFVSIIDVVYPKSILVNETIIFHYVFLHLQLAANILYGFYVDRISSYNKTILEIKFYKRYDQH